MFKIIKKHKKLIHLKIINKKISNDLHRTIYMKDL